MLLILRLPPVFFFFFFNDTATTEIYTLSLHDALPISSPARLRLVEAVARRPSGCVGAAAAAAPWESSFAARSEEHTSELQSPCNLVCRLLLEKKKIIMLIPVAHDDTVYVQRFSPHDGH